LGADNSLKCSFCHKAQGVVGKLITSPSDYPRAYICDECIAVCNSIMEDDKPEPAPANSDQETQRIRNEIHSLVDQLADGDIRAAQKILVALTRPF
jgi:ATP-dependent Clp protease ATP-binding subunit ClpX